MRSRIDTIREVKAREEAAKERQRRAAAQQTASASPETSSHPSSVAGMSSKRSSSLMVLWLQITLATILILGTIFGANEAMVFLLN
jgi:hypothetical protein